jgi:hypothetical protein
MGELDRKGDDKKRAEKEDRKRRTEVDEQEEGGKGKEDELNLLPWDADVDRFLTLLETSLRDFRASMSGNEFRDLSLRYRDLTPTEKRAVSNRLQRRRLGNLLRAIHANDYSAYIAGWEMEAKAAGEEVAGPRPDSP